MIGKVSTLCPFFLNGAPKNFLKMLPAAFPPYIDRMSTYLQLFEYIPLHITLSTKCFRKPSSVGSLATGLTKKPMMNMPRQFNNLLSSVISRR